MKLEEKVDLCSRALIAWISTEQSGKDLKIHDKDIENMFISQVLLKKLDAFGIDIHLPDMLLTIVTVCTEGNPGQSQMIIKDLLNDIKKCKGPIPDGYVVTTMDFSLCFGSGFPITENKIMNDKYYKMWEDQKYLDKNEFRQNLCDTPDFWKEVMQ